ncbi:hypothetical protein RvY_12749 [Ramazzottius varieornatus]|uniref:SCP domain-containing protein n=1 Tax=Ramazzottius varieornatus TaxID=947166 RepID=A0A1D1VQZ6_RAMVA|nr:hypothetical protein RvY_12749 [Ramazzottius varieornatus]
MITMYSLIITVCALALVKVDCATYMEDHRKPGGKPMDMDALTALGVTPVSGEGPEGLNHTHAPGEDLTNHTHEATPVKIPDVEDALAAVTVNGTADEIADRWGPTDTSDPVVQFTIVDLHNSYRRRHPAANMLMMRWSTEAADLAQAWANNCTFNYSECAVRNTSMYECGQTIARSSFQMSWNATLQLWYNQVKDFRFNQDPTGSGIVGDFTQMVWAKTWQVGCGYHFCSTSGFHLYVCNYCPSGNDKCSLNKPFEPSPDRGRVCDRCGGPSASTCHKGLCTNQCEQRNELSNCDKADGHFPALFPDGCSTDKNAEFKTSCNATCECKEKGLLY